MYTLKAVVRIRPLTFIAVILGLLIAPFAQAQPVTKEVVAKPAIPAELLD